MRRRLLDHAQRLASRRHTPRGEVSRGSSVFALPEARTAVGPPSTSSASILLVRPASILLVRPASTLTSRGLACPPHGGKAASSTSSTPPPPDHDPAADALYQSAADDALHALLDGLEAWVDDTPGLEDADVEYSVSVEWKERVSCSCLSRPLPILNLHFHPLDFS